MIDGSSVYVHNEEFEKPNNQTALRESQAKVHHFGTIDGRTFIVEEEEFEKPLIQKSTIES